MMTFTDSALLLQDSVKRIMAFELKPGYGGIMQDFEGFWLIKGAPGPDGLADKVQHMSER